MPLGESRGWLRQRGPRILKHSFATEYCRAGGNVRVLQAIMGHERLETTMIYVHLADLAIAQDHARCCPFTRLRVYS